MYKSNKNPHVRYNSLTLYNLMRHNEAYSEMNFMFITKGEWRSGLIHSVVHFSIRKHMLKEGLH